MRVVNVESCGDRDSHILYMDEPNVVKTTCGLLISLGLFCVGT